MPSAYSPYIPYIKFAKHLLYILLSLHKAASVKLGVLFAEFGGNLGKGLCMGDAYAYRYAGIFEDFAAKFKPKRLQLFERYSSHIQKGLIYRIDLYAGERLLKDRHYAGREVAVEDVVG